MDLIINILVGLIILTLLALALYNFLPQIEEFLEEKFNIKVNIARNSANIGVLGEIFFKYNHRDVDAWIEWMKISQSSIKTKAIQTLIEHIESVPANWGGITPEAIRALSQFNQREHITIFKTNLSVAKRSWKKYKVSSSCYEASLKAILAINEESGIKTLEEELAKRLSSGNEDKTICILNALATCSENSNIEHLFIRILTNPDEDIKAKNHAVGVVQKFSPEKSNSIFFTSVKKLIEETKEPLSQDNLNSYETILNLCTKSISPQTFDYIIQACNHSFLSTSTLNVLDLALKSSKDIFKPEQLYKLLNHIRDDRDKIGTALSVANGLSAAEKEILRYNDPLKTFAFTKAPVVEININNATAIEVPKILVEYNDRLLSAIKERASKKQSGQAGGLLITGFTESEKILLCRSIAVEKRWSFIYGNYDDLVSSGSNAKNYFDIVTKNKPCIAFLDDIGNLITNKNESFLKYLKQIANDPSVFVVGALKEEVITNEKGVCSLIENDDEMTSIFPKTVEINKCSDSFKMRVLQPKLGFLDAIRGADKLERLDINKPSADMSPLEYEKFLTNYLRISLLIYGKLINADEYIRLNQIEKEAFVKA
jgi:hypothetical protein